MRARCFNICITLSAHPPLPEFSPRTTGGSVGNRAVHARRFPLEGADLGTLLSLVEPSAQLISAQLNKDAQNYRTGSTQLNSTTKS